MADKIQVVEGVVSTWCQECGSPTVEPMDGPGKTRDNEWLTPFEGKRIRVYIEILEH